MNLTHLLTDLSPSLPRPPLAELPRSTHSRSSPSFQLRTLSINPCQVRVISFDDTTNWNDIEVPAPPPPDSLPPVIDFTEPTWPDIYSPPLDPPIPGTPVTKDFSGHLRSSLSFLSSQLQVNLRWFQPASLNRCMLLTVVTALTAPTPSPSLLPHTLIDMALSGRWIATSLEVTPFSPFHIFTPTQLNPILKLGRKLQLTRI